MSRMPPLSVAPMMDITDRHFRRFVRTISSHVLLYTEMVTEQAIRHGDTARLLGFDETQHPVSLQLGGSDARGLAHATRVAFDFGYDEVNLNVGCPSDRVQSGRFGACLMNEPEHVASLVEAMIEASPLPVTIKHRVGVDDNDTFDSLLHFVDTVAAAGVTRFTVHARKAWLKGLSPRENREVPPLRYDTVKALASRRPELSFELNGGIGSLAQAREHLSGVDAVMLGRAVASDPYVLARADTDFFGAETEVPTRTSCVLAYLPYLESELGRGVKFRVLIRPLLGMFSGLRGARAWRRSLSEASLDPAAGPDEVLQALGHVVDESPHRPATLVHA